LFKLRQVLLLNKNNFMDNNADTYLSELEELLSLQASYFDNLIKMGIILENAGQPQKAMEVYKKGMETADKAKTELSYTMMVLMD